MEIADKQENNSRVIGRPFTKGVSGNPKGRPLKGQTIADCVREYLDELDSETGLSRKEKLVKKIVDRALNGDISATKLVWAYVDGLPRQTQVIASNEDLHVFITEEGNLQADNVYNKFLKMMEEEFGTKREDAKNQFKY